MGVVENMTTALGLVLNDACELQSHIARYRRKQITREQFVAGVDELAGKIVQRAHETLCVETENDIPF